MGMSGKLFVNAPNFTPEGGHGVNFHGYIRKIPSLKENAERLDLGKWGDKIIPFDVASP
jgi:hypothetical protein